MPALVRSTTAMLSVPFLTCKGSGCVARPRDGNSGLWRCGQGQGQEGGATTVGTGARTPAKQSCIALHVWLPHETLVRVNY